MAKAGWDVQVLEKQSTAGGRARMWRVDGFSFDMGPSWYWMPEVFERFFNKFGKKVSDFYTLRRLDPSYRIYWDDDVTDIPADYAALKALFEKFEKGSSQKLDQFLAEAEYKYKVGINKLVFKPGQSITEFADWDLVKGLFRLDVFSSIQTHVHKYFKNPRLRQILEFPVLFLGALPENTPALYSLMNYADIKLGTWFPEGGMYKIVEGMYSVARDQGVKFAFNSNVSRIELDQGVAKKVVTENGDVFEADVVIGGADYHFIETELLPETHRSYSAAYWDKRVMAPGCLLFYVGVKRKLKNLQHHSLFFDVPFETHAKEIYESPSWPVAPLFYLCASSVTDPSQAPEGCENLFFLIPLAAGLEGDTEQVRERYFEMMLERLKAKTGEDVKDDIIVKRSFSLADFKSVYNAFKGNAYGLANTLMQTAVLKPSCRSGKVRNLFYTGQLTVPGPGVPPSLISGEVVAGEVVKHFGK